MVTRWATARRDNQASVDPPTGSPASQMESS